MLQAQSLLNKILVLTQFMIVASKGQKSGLSLFVRSYSANVECIEDQPFDDDGQCSKVLDSLPVSSRKLVFARPRSEDPDPRTVIVPVGGKYIGDGEYKSETLRWCTLPKRDGLIIIK